MKLHRFQDDDGEWHESPLSDADVKRIAVAIADVLLSKRSSTIGADAFDHSTLQTRAQRLVGKAFRK